MKKNYVSPECEIMDVYLETAIISGSDNDWPETDLEGGGGTGAGGIFEGDAPPRGGYSDMTYTERNGGWKRGGLW